MSLEFVGTSKHNGVELNGVTLYFRIDGVEYKVYIENDFVKFWKVYVLDNYEVPLCIDRIVMQWLKTDEVGKIYCPENLVELKD